MLCSVKIKPLKEMTRELKRTQDVARNTCLQLIVHDTLR